MKDFLTSKTGIIVAGSSTFVLIGLIVGLFLWSPWSSSGDDNSRGLTSSGEEIPDGYTDKVTVETMDPNQAQPAQERPEELPPLIYAEGECKVTFDAMRALFEKHPSGLTLDQAGADELNALLPQISANCDAETATAFQNQELSPWMVYSTE